jgi:HAMP domain-containing protein
LNGASLHDRIPSLSPQTRSSQPFFAPIQTASVSSADRITVRTPLRFPIAAKFAVMLAVLVAAVIAVGFTGLRGLSNLNNHVNSLYKDHIVTLERTTAFATDTATAAKLAFQIIVSNSALEIAHLEDQLTNEIVPRVNSDLEGLRAAHALDSPAERAKVSQESESWTRFLALRSGKPLDSVAQSDSAGGHDNVLAGRVRAIFEPIERDAQQQTSLETSESAVLAAQAQTRYHDSRNLVLLIVGIAIVLAGGVVALLIRAVVPRIRRYSNFALRVEEGEATSGVAVSGRDELSELGTALNEMVKKRVSERTREDLQAEFAEVMQLTQTEEEAYKPPQAPDRAPDPEQQRSHAEPQQQRRPPRGNHGARQRLTAGRPTGQRQTALVSGGALCPYTHRATRWPPPDLVRGVR